MIYTLEFHPDIEIDYSEAYEWYEEKKQGLGDLFLKSVREKLKQVVEHPLTFSERSRKGYREAKVKTFPYLIVYKIYSRKKIIFINTIHHSSRNPRNKYRK